MKSLKFVLAASAFLGRAAFAAETTPVAETGSPALVSHNSPVRYEVVVAHRSGNHVDRSQHSGVFVLPGQRTTFSSITSDSSTPLVTVGRVDPARSDMKDGVSFSLLPEYTQADGSLTTQAEYVIWEQGTVVQTGSYTFRQGVGQEFLMPRVGNYEFTVTFNGADAVAKR